MRRNTRKSINPLHADFLIRFPPKPVQLPKQPGMISDSLTPLLIRIPCICRVPYASIATPNSNIQAHFYFPLLFPIPCFDRY